MAMSGALVPVKNPSLRCVFSKLNPTNPAPSRPVITARSTVTVPLAVGPVKTGPDPPVLELADELLVSTEDDPLPPAPPAAVLVETAPRHAPSSEARPTVAANFMRGSYGAN
jgi:hypothetical protein